MKRMRKILIALVVVIMLAVLWLWRGRDLSTLADRFETIETSARSITAIIYEGSGTGGLLHVDDVDLSLNEVELGGATPSVGTTKDEQLALSFTGKVFRFGPVQDDKLAANVVGGDTATISIEHGAMPWPNFFETNFMTGNSPTWKRNRYQKLVWKKPDGTKLEMLWRYEQYSYPNDGWTTAFMTRPGSTGLIRIEISNASR
ncbi:MAG TPA: hypothetical protein VG103_05540 [Chthoniobacterales bacterium]|jgi:hypothetical protein|nr:hypothetical protein [Chthoniobacterales bacterium]